MSFGSWASLGCTGFTLVVALEDLWWTHSEEIALHEVFDEALDDYRRKHVLNLQKRKLELSQRLTKLRLRLEDTIKQCFLKRSLSA